RGSGRAELRGRGCPASTTSSRCASGQIDDYPDGAGGAQFSAVLGDPPASCRTTSLSPLLSRGRHLFAPDLDGVFAPGRTPATRPLPAGRSASEIWGGCETVVSGALIKPDLPVGGVFPCVRGVRGRWRRRGSSLARVPTATRLNDTHDRRRSPAVTRP